MVAGQKNAGIPTGLGLAGRAECRLAALNDAKRQAD